ncbi:MFS transporter [Amycolatopsis alkalitolerans]|uniref:MFS transporter n=1 Tax=Amycolatopsis alkalitolerans TaxID=2547244 RepID=A0A5C4LXJ1_9PSEU|nr:MFS transporter [Amycolatopsis alkalitolerans]TNC24311.1 MFS transporter [Amycolatopsis alkalitolerans]
MVGDRVAVFVVFALNGAAYGSWAPRVPALAERLHAAPGSLGLALLGGSIGMVVAASMSGRLVERFGTRTAIIASTLLTCVFLPFVGAAGSVPALGFVMFGLGASVGALDVSMNIGAVGVERRLGRAIMPFFHAGFSFGGLIASSAAGLAAAHQWSPFRHLLVAGAVVLIALLLVLPGLPRAAPRAERAAPIARTALVRRPVLWLLAAIALCSAIAEGASSDWSALLLVTAQHVGQAAAALAFAVFSLTMAVTRLGGAWAQNRFGPVRTLVAGAALAGLGLVLAAVVPVAGLAFAGFGLAGAGLAASFPIALSLAGAAGKRADGSGGEREIAFVTTIAYSGFLAGPPVIGGIAQLSSLPVSFVLVGFLAALIAPAAVGAGRARHRELTAATAAV